MKFEKTVQVCSQEGAEQIDVTKPLGLEIRIRGDGKVVWINVDGRCMFRACQIEELILEDERNGDPMDKQDRIETGNH